MSTASYGDGSGDGDGDGYGSGDGSGYGEIDLEFSQLLAAHLGKKAAPKLAKEKCVFAYWKSKRDGSPANGGSGGVRKAGDVEEIKGPLKLCGPGALHATHHLQSWSGEKLWLVALHGEVGVNSDKIGALKRTIICEVDKKAVGL